MKIIIRFVTILAILTSLTACAPIISGSMNASLTEEDVVAKTADYFGTTAQNLVITSIKKEALWTTYQTTYNGTLYNCQIYYGAAECVKPGG